MGTSLNNIAHKEADFYRKELLADLPVKEQQLKAGGVPTTYLQGGEGAPLVLLHGPGEPSIWWMRVIPKLREKFTVIVPDLPGHGSSGALGKKFSSENILLWLVEFLHKTCKKPPVLVGHVVGGAIAARYAIQYGKKVKQIVLVDSLGLSAFRPAPRFALELLQFMIRPSQKSQKRLLTQCMFNMNELSKSMGKNWQPFLDYNLASAKNPEKKSAAKEIMSAMSGKIPENELKKIKVPVTLIWGRHDKANRLKVAIKASEKYGWPLHIIEDTRDDPKLERPDAFVEAVQSSVAEPILEKHGY